MRAFILCAYVRTRGIRFAYAFACARVPACVIVSRVCMCIRVIRSESLFDYNNSSTADAGNVYLKFHRGVGADRGGVL